MKRLTFSVVSCCVMLSCLTPKVYAENVVLFDIEKRKQELQTREYQQLVSHCMAENLGAPDEQMPQPIPGLREVKRYGTDRSLSDFTWYMMIHSGRALTGNSESHQRVKDALLSWSAANALHDTDVGFNPYYALKRGLIPIIQAYLIIEADLEADERQAITQWLDPLVRRVDKRFNGKVDHNNHRYLADSVLTLWGDAIGDETLYAKGKERFIIALQEMQPDGSLPLETQRGARALWYLRQSITNLLVIAEIYRLNGEDLYALNIEGKSLSLLVNYFISGVNSPLLLHREAAKNLRPGPSTDFLAQDTGMLHRRGSRRHYMAFAYPYIQYYRHTDISSVRLHNLMERTAFQELPLVDDFMGGNATCFWGMP